MRVVMLGAGGQALELSAFCAEAGLMIAAFIDEPGFEARRRELPAPIHSSAELPDELAELPALLAAGSPALRRRWVAERRERGWAQLIHPSAWQAESAAVGAGTVLAPHAILGPLVRVGDHVLINCAASFHHGTVVGDHAVVGPGARVAGNVVIGAGVVLGIGASVVEEVSIGEGAVVGAGAAVTSDVAPLTVVAGVPARVIGEREDWS